MPKGISKAFSTFLYPQYSGLSGALNKDIGIQGTDSIEASGTTIVSKNGL